MARSVKLSERDHKRITAALEGRLDPGELTEEESIAWTEAFIKKMGEPSVEEKAFFAELSRLG